MPAGPTTGGGGDSGGVSHQVGHRCAVALPSWHPCVTMWQSSMDNVTTSGSLPMVGHGAPDSMNSVTVLWTWSSKHCTNVQGLPLSLVVQTDNSVPVCSRSKAGIFGRRCMLAGSRGCQPLRFISFRDSCIKGNIPNQSTLSASRYTVPTTTFRVMYCWK